MEKEKRDIKVSWDETEDKEYLEYDGVVVRAEFDTEWANFKEPGEKQSPFEGHNIRLELRVIDPEGWENQYISYIQPSDRKGTKWQIFRDCLKKTGAWKDLNITGNTDYEKIQSLCKSIVGMAFHVERHQNYPSPWGKGFIKQVHLITKYHGRMKIEPVTEVKSEEIKEESMIEME